MIKYLEHLFEFTAHESCGKCFPCRIGSVRGKKQKKKAPVLISEEMIQAMRNGSVIIDLAAATGGNTPVTRNNETVVYNGVSIAGNSSLQSTMPSDASKMYGKNVLNFLQLIITKEGQVNLNWEDDLVKGSCMTHNGKIVHERLK